MNAMKQLPSILFLLAFLAMFSPVRATAEEAPAEPETRTAEASDPETGEEDASSEEPQSEVFLPTEEISEDFAFSFPVDI
jgi:hypothetical protein